MILSLFMSFHPISISFEMESETNASTRTLSISNVMFPELLSSASSTASSLMSLLFESKRMEFFFTTSIATREIVAPVSGSTSNLYSPRKCLIVHLYLGVFAGDNVAIIAREFTMSLFLCTHAVFLQPASPMRSAVADALRSAESADADASGSSDADASALLAGEIRRHARSSL